MASAESRLVILCRLQLITENPSISKALSHPLNNFRVLLKKVQTIKAIWHVLNFYISFNKNLSPVRTLAAVVKTAATDKGAKLVLSCLPSFIYPAIFKINSSWCLLLLAVFSSNPRHSSSISLNILWESFPSFSGSQNQVHTVLFSFQEKMWRLSTGWSRNRCRLDKDDIDTVKYLLCVDREMWHFYSVCDLSD